MTIQQVRVRKDRKDKPVPSKPRVNFDLVLKEVSEVIAPVWPLKDYVAVNPYFGLADKPFLSARSFLRLLGLRAAHACCALRGTVAARRADWARY